MRTALVLLVGALGAAPAFAHGASRGLHVHAAPEACEPGAVVTVSVDASAPVTRLTIGFAGEKPKVVVPKVPDRHVASTLVVPAGPAGSTASIQAEATTSGGKTLRASALISRKTPR